jgi:predicted lactoylglutathione lyase
MNEVFKLGDSRFDMWQFNFISTIENEWRKWKIPVDNVQALLIHQSIWSSVFNDRIQNSKRDNSVLRLITRVKYQRFIEKFVACLENNPNVPESEVERFKSGQINQDEDETITNDGDDNRKMI